MTVYAPFIDMEEWGADVAEPDPKVVEWVELAKQGDQEAFAEIVYTFQDSVYNLCYRMLGERTEAEDASQEAFIRAYSNLRRYDTARSFKTWLLSIASYHCIDRLRKRRMKFLSLDEPLPAGSALALSSDDPGPEERAVRSEREQLIQEILTELKPDYRAAVVLRYWYDYSYAEIAETLETTESAIKSRLFRARQMLAEKMQNRQASSRDDGSINPLLEAN